MVSNFQFNAAASSKAPMRVVKKLSDQTLQEEWVEIQAAQKEAAMFRPLYERYYEQIFRFIFRRTTDESLSADICSQVFLKALQKLPKYQFKGVPFSAWLYRIASNEVTQHYRNTSKNRVVCVEDSHFTDLQEEMEVEEKPNLSPLMLEALNELPLRDMQMVELRFFEQRAFKEIAEIMEITESNAKVKTYRILAKLKKIIEGKNRGI